MKVSRWGALGGALVLAAVAAPAAVVHGQTNRASAVRVWDVSGSNAQIGVTVQEPDADDAKAPKAGVLIADVRSGGPAEKAGIKAGDAIVEFDGDRVRSVRQFTRLVQESAAGRSLPVVLTRNGNRMTVNVTPESQSAYDDFTYRLLDGARIARPTPTPPALAPMAPGFDYFRGGRRQLGITLESLDDQLAGYFGVKDGVLVKAVEPESAGQKAGLKAGDVITSVNGRKIYETSDVPRAIDRSDDSAEFTVEIVRDKKPQTLKGKLESTRPRARGVRTIV